MLLLLGLAWVALPSPIEDFLQKNGFSDVKENFLENEVTLQVVGLLTDDDLTKLGLLTIGRRRLFNLAAASVAQGGGREEENEREVEAGREEGREEERVPHTQSADSTPRPLLHRPLTPSYPTPRWSTFSSSSSTSPFSSAASSSSTSPFSCPRPWWR